MRIAQIFTMGGGGGRGYDGGYSGYNPCCKDCGCNFGRDSLDDPRLRRTGLAEIIGSRANGGSGLSALFEEDPATR